MSTREGSGVSSTVSTHPPSPVPSERLGSSTGPITSDSRTSPSGADRSQAANTPPATPLDTSLTHGTGPIPGPNFKHQNIKSKGTHARFLCQNPRYINEPVCQMQPNEGSYSVRDCLSWSQEHRSKEFASISDRQRKTTEKRTSTPREEDARPAAGKKIGFKEKLNPITPDLAAPMTEKISYRHGYNSRITPNEPPRGRLQGSFVTEQVQT